MSKIPFPFSTLTATIDQKVFQLIGELQRQQTELLLSPRNIQRFQHGKNWRTHSGDDAAREQSSMQLHQVEHAFEYQAIVDHKLEVLVDLVRTIVGQMSAKLRGSLYAKVSESSERVGNVVSASNFASNEEAFLEMLHKIEFGVDEAGQVSLPEVHLAPDNPMLVQLQNAGPDFHARVEEMIARKSAEALEREKQRKKKFVGRP